MKMARNIAHTALLFFVTFVGTTPAQTPEDLFKKLTEAIKAHCPEASIEVTDKKFKAKYDTMVFMSIAKKKRGVNMVRSHTIQKARTGGASFSGFL